MQLHYRRPGWIWLGLSIGIGVLLAAGCLWGAANAQTGEKAIFSGLNTSGFPRLQASLAVYDEASNFILDLKPENIAIVGGGQRITPVSLAYSRPGVVLVTALSLGPAMGVRDGQGMTRLDYLKAALQLSESSYITNTVDDFSLLIANGPEVTHLSSHQDWLNALINFTPDNLRSATPDLAILGRALSIINDPAPRPGMGKVVLFITAPQPISNAQGLLSIANTARQQGVHIFVWQVSSFADSVSMDADPLRQLAEQTGGAFVNFDQPAALPAVNDYLEPLRSVYQVEFTTTLTTNGIYTVSAEVQLNNKTLLSNSLELQVALRPPNPIFVGLPVRIERWIKSNITTTALTPSDKNVLAPASQNLEILVEFPDGQPRPLRKATLFVNGSAVQVNSSPPFEHFTWDLNGFTVDSRCILHVEVVDSLGMVGRSMELPVDIHIDLPNHNKSQGLTVTPQIVLEVLLGALVLGALTGLGLLLAGKLQPSQLGRMRRRRKPLSSPATLPLTQTPITAPINQPAAPANRLPNWIGRLQRNTAPPSTQPIAYLTPFSEDDEQGVPIPIQNLETTFGRDGEKASWALDDPCLDDLHARLRREGTAYRLLDEGTIAGTWVNYREVPPGGSRLEHGDIIHFGKIGFRFTLREARQARKPIISLYTPPSRSGPHETH